MRSRALVTITLILVFSLAALGTAAAAPAENETSSGPATSTVFISFVPIWFAFFVIFTSPTYPVTQLLMIARSRDTGEKRRRNLRNHVSARFAAREGFARLQTFQPPKKEQIKIAKVGAVQRVTVGFREGLTYVFTVRRRDRAVDGRGGVWVVDDISGGEFDE